MSDLEPGSAPHEILWAEAERLRKLFKGMPPEDGAGFGIVAIAVYESAAMICAAINLAAKEPK